MNTNDEILMPVAVPEDWTAEKWAAEWKKEAQARVKDFLTYKAKKEVLEYRINEMSNAISSSIELLQGLDAHLNQNQGLLLLMAIENLKPYSK